MPSHKAFMRCSSLFGGAGRLSGGAAAETAASRIAFGWSAEALFGASLGAGGAAVAATLSAALTPWRNG
jgi:hypothetical protein